MNDGVLQSGDRLEVNVVREKDGKKFYTKIGALFVNRDGSCTIKLDAAPIGDGTLYCSWPYEKREQNEASARRATRASRPNNAAPRRISTRDVPAHPPDDSSFTEASGDDDIPFD